MKTLLLAAVLLCACTKTQANAIISAADVGCEFVVKAEGFPDLCASADEIAKAIVALTNLPQAHYGEKPKPPTMAQIRAQILKQRQESAK